MFEIFKYGFAFAVCMPLGVGLLAWLTQIHTVRDCTSRTGEGWDERDTFEIKDAVLGAVTFLAPMGAMFDFVLVKPSLPDWQWRAIMGTIIAVVTSLSMWRGHWSVARRKAIENATTVAKA